MFANSIPEFKNGSILKKEMLENIRDFPREFVDIYYKEYSNGIICGCDLNILDYEIIVNSGIIKFNNKIYSLKEAQALKYQNYDKNMILKIKFYEAVNDHNFINFETKLFLEDNLEIHENEMELGRFKLKEGAKLRDSYTDYLDLSTEYNTINIVNVDYSGFKKSTLNPLILKTFSEALLKSSTKETEDLIFSMYTLNSKIIERDLIVEYINRKLNADKKSYSNSEIYKNLLKILKNLKEGRRQNEPINRNRPNVILVD